MNRWAEDSAQFAQQENYLDRLQEIYPSEPGERKISEKELEAIRSAFDSGDKFRLLSVLLDLDKFPYEESYKQFLKSDRRAGPGLPLAKAGAGTPADLLRKSNRGGYRIWNASADAIQHPS